jgi:hypothetical protein
MKEGTMQKYFLVTVVALAALGLSASVARAQCGFEHPVKAKKLQANLVQAMVSCGNPGGNAVNDNTEGGVPSCSPPETFNEQAGSPANGWLWDETRSSGMLRLQAKTSPYPASNDTTLPPPCANPLLCPAGAVDLFVGLRLKAILDAAGPANGTGTLATVARATINDRGTDGMAGTGDDTDMTIVDFPAGFPFTLENGKTNLKSSAAALLNAIGQKSLPSCSSIEVVAVSVLDENGNGFASIGTFLDP